MKLYTVEGKVFLIINIACRKWEGNDLKTFDLNSGTKVMVDESKIVIERTGGKSALKGIFAGRTMGQMSIKTSALTGLIFFADYLVICASGLPSPNDFKITNIAEIKQYPNCIVGKEQELAEIYQYLNGFITN